MYGTNNDYEEAIKDARIHAYDNYQEKRNSIVKLLSFSVLAVIFTIGFHYYQESSIEKELIPNNKLLVDNTQSTKEVLEIGHDKIQISEDAYLLALERMKVDVLDNSNIIYESQ